jgi:hypothetical protein
MTESDFNLRALVRTVTAETTSPDNWLIAKETARRVPPDHIDAALVEALAEYVRHFQTTLRPRGFGGTSGGGNANSGKSSKVAAIRAAYRRLLEAPYDTATGQKYLGDCTAEDLIFIADGLEEQARQNMAKASGFRGLSVVLGERGVARLRDLPDDVLVQHLNGGAA